MSPTEACATITSTLGAASRSSVGVIGASMRWRVRGSNCRDASSGLLSPCVNARSSGSALIVMRNIRGARLTLGVHAPIWVHIRISSSEVEKPHEHRYPSQDPGLHVPRGAPGGAPRHRVL